MKHLVVIKSGLWSGKVVYFQGAVFTTPGETNLMARDIVSANIVEGETADQPGHHVVEIVAQGWEMVVELSTRAFQSIRAHQTVNLVVSAGSVAPSNMSLDQQLAYHEQNAAKRTCCGG